MDRATMLLLYSIIYRALIIISGITCIVLGYKLFCRGVYGGGRTGKPTDVKGSATGMSLTVKNAAPGTCFALFGAAIIIVMMLNGPSFQMADDLRTIPGASGETAPAVLSSKEATPKLPPDAGSRPVPGGMSADPAMRAHPVDRDPRDSDLRVYPDRPDPKPAP